MPWKHLIQIYHQHLSQGPAITLPARIIIGSLIIKHKLNLSDAETVQTIEENPYMQFFLGLEVFHPRALFHPTALVNFRKRLGKATFDELSNALIRICSADRLPVDEGSPSPNRGKLQLDATVADQYIRYPNDLSLLNEARQKTEDLIDELYEHTREQLRVKPRTYRRVARRKYLEVAKRKKNRSKLIRTTQRYLINCVERNIVSIHRMLDLLPSNPLEYAQMRTLWIIQTLCQQQRQMYDRRERRCDDRIVSIHQPHVRPIVRGQVGKEVEFGSKLGLAQMDGFIKAETLSWNAYHESQDLPAHVAAYRELYGYYPELVQVDKLYGTNANSQWCKQRGIRLTVAAKGRPKKEKPTAAQRRNQKKEYTERNRIERKIGQAKQGYKLNQIRAKLKDTSECWIGIILFVTNLVRFAQIHQIPF